MWLRRSAVRARPTVPKHPIEIVGRDEFPLRGNFHLRSAWEVPGYHHAPKGTYRWCWPVASRHSSTTTVVGRGNSGRQHAFAPAAGPAWWRGLVIEPSIAGQPALWRQILRLSRGRHLAAVHSFGLRLSAGSGRIASYRHAVRDIPPGFVIVPLANKAMDEAWPRAWRYGFIAGRAAASSIRLTLRLVRWISPSVPRAA